MVYDGIGKTTFPASLDCLRPLGMFASFGSASGQIEAFNINILQTKGSLFATRPTLNNYVAKRDDLLDIAKNLFEVVGSGKVKIPVNQKYKLKDAVKAHQDLEGRNTTGSTILVPVSGFDRWLSSADRQPGRSRHPCCVGQAAKRWIAVYTAMHADLRTAMPGVSNDCAMGRLTTHVLDTASGKPAAGVRVVLRRDGDAAVMAEGADQRRRPAGQAAARRRRVQDRAAMS